MFIENTFIKTQYLQNKKKEEEKEETGKNWSNKLQEEKNIHTKRIVITMLQLYRKKSQEKDLSN